MLHTKYGKTKTRNEKSTKEYKKIGKSRNIFCYDAIFTEEQVFNSSERMNKERKTEMFH